MICEFQEHVKCVNNKYKEGMVFSGRWTNNKVERKLNKP